MHQLQSKEDLSPLDFAKTALMLLVVLYHSVLFWGGNWFTKDPLFACFHRHSFPIYLFHQQMIFCSICWLNGRLNPYLHAALNMVLAATLSLLLSMLLQRFSATRFLTGQKP